MAKICNAHPKQSSGTYDKVLSNKELSGLITKVQSTTISLGTDLEKKIEEASRKNVNPKFDTFIDMLHNDEVEFGVYLFSKKDVNSGKYRINRKEPDFIIFDVSETEKNCCIIELKAGDNFDTKKSTAEREQLSNYAQAFSELIKCKTGFKICCFNQNNKEVIVAGLKNRFDISEVLTGEEFCEWIGVKYENIQKSIEEDALENTEWLIDKITEIACIQNKMYEKFCRIVVEEEFYDEQD